MVLASSLTGFDVEFIDGVKGDDVPEKTRPLVRCVCISRVYTVGLTGSRD